MIASHPYNNWPLHVKIFTPEALSIWESLQNSPRARSFVMPPGFTWSLELEGVDGQSGQRGTGRTGPIDTRDGSYSTYSEVMTDHV